MSSAGTVDNRIQIFDLNNYEHIHTWSWLAEGVSVDTESENNCDIACSLTVDHVAVCAGNVIKVYDIGYVEKRLVNGELHENVSNTYRSMKANPTPNPKCPSF